MRTALAFALALSIPATAAWAQDAKTPATAPAPATAMPAPAPAAAPTPAAAPAAKVGTTADCKNPNALGVERVVQIDTTGGPGFGFEHFKAYDFLKDKEVVLTFDDGPWQGNTERVLKALADECTKALFFEIGKHAGYYPEITKQVAKAGHTIGSHTWSHKDLSTLSEDEAKAEIEKGIAAVSIALGNQPVAPFFRFPALRHPPEMVTYLGTRNIAIFSTDMDSFDFKMRKPEQVIKSVMDKLEKNGKGIILMHDFQHATAEALPELLKQMKEKGYKVVHMKPKFLVKSLPEYDVLVLKEQKLPTANVQPTSSIVKTIEE